VIRLDDVTKAYGEGRRAVTALDGVSLAIGRGEFVGVVGPRGAGKSTLLHVIGGLDAPTAGSVRIDGRALDGMDDDVLALFRRRHVGFLFQDFHLVPTLTAGQNVALPLVFEGMPADEAVGHAVGALDRLGLAHRADHRPDALAPGERRSVALARALATAPPVLLVDEPTAALDPASGARLLRHLRAEAWRCGRTVVMATDDDAVAAVADRRVALVDGRLVTDALVAGGGGRPAPAA